MDGVRLLVIVSARSVSGDRRCVLNQQGQGTGDGR
jgi:hypothetical protein